MDDRISAGVGRLGQNKPADVLLVQQLLIRHAQWLGSVTPPQLSSHCDDATIRAIIAFEENAAALLVGDGTVRPNDFTFRTLSRPYIPPLKARVFVPMCWAHPGKDKLTDQSYHDAAVALAGAQKADEKKDVYDYRVGQMKAAILAVRDVETSGADPWDGLGRPTILFERHLFHKFTHGAYQPTHPDISNPNPGGYGGTRKGLELSNFRYERLRRAAMLDESAALRATSWGRFQVLGMNYANIGYASPVEMVDKILASERAHLDAFIGYVRSVHGCVAAMARQDWDAVAKAYNGTNYAKIAAKQHRERYDVLLGRAYARHAPPAPPPPAKGAAAAAHAAGAGAARPATVPHR